MSSRICDLDLSHTPLQVWRQTLWTDIKTEVMEEGTKAFVKEVKALPKAVRDEDCFKVSAWAFGNVRHAHTQLQWQPHMSHLDIAHLQGMHQRAVALLLCCLLCASTMSEKLLFLWAVVSATCKGCMQLV